MNKVLQITRIHAYLTQIDQTDLACQLEHTVTTLQSGIMIPEHMVNVLVGSIEHQLNGAFSSGYIEDFRRHLYGLTGTNITLHKMRHATA